LGIVKVPYIKKEEPEQVVQPEQEQAREGSTNWILHKLAHKISNVHDPTHVDNKNLLCTEDYFDKIIREIARSDPKSIPESLAAKIENFVGKSGKDSVKIALKKLKCLATTIERFRDGIYKLLPNILDLLVIYRKISDKAVTLNSLCVQVGILNHFPSEIILTSLVSANNENTHKKDDIVYADHYLDLMLYFLPHITDTFIDVRYVRLAIFNLTELWSVFPTLCQKVDQALQILDFVDKNDTGGHFNDFEAKQ
jgi:hypothetical protein